MRTFRQFPVFALLSASFLLVPQVVSGQTVDNHAAVYKTPAQLAAEELAALRARVQQSPQDGNAHFALAEALRKRDRKREAALEYAQTINLLPELWVAYHQLSQVSDDTQQLDDAVARLTKLKAEKPKDLMLRVALSELLEKRRNYSQAARVLIEITYDNAVPPKYSQRVNGRIHYLLSKSKEAQLAAKDDIPSDEDLDVVPAPLPDTGLRKGLTASKINESKRLKGLGHVPLLP